MAVFNRFMRWIGEAVTHARCASSQGQVLFGLDQIGFQNPSVMGRSLATGQTSGR